MTKEEILQELRSDYGRRPPDDYTLDDWADVILEFIKLAEGDSNG